MRVVPERFRDREPGELEAVGERLGEVRGQQTSETDRIPTFGFVIVACPRRDPFRVSRPLISTFATFPPLLAIPSRNPSEKSDYTHPVSVSILLMLRD